ncbi:conserved hypothetical protein [Candida dubliniensis CD36]|uniref:Uncharacterized protein n=1 Tax=Candida dubliniensis (strain CD36 / ATCC MYA-646 / CBS 7987 / NCPF 3949 / NRRL Y-17841) TaxID=573826 RepID=B9W9V9_CANDC|nr:conserved hypothetical protein [Candida dubliniensis CD36]CAX45597.1 conserved hypothetical protein [Candida dubliniensis CD36]
MSDEIISQARAYLETSQPEKALDLLYPYIESQIDSVPYLSILGETYLENNELEKAYQILIRGCELDPEANQGFEKFLYLGQIIGGQDGINYINIAINKLQSLLSEDEDLNKKSFFINKLNSAIFAEIEIWMTDLCMESEAELKCNELIDYSLQLDNTNPEAFSLLSSIRISQQRNQEAIEALLKSWELFKLKKTKLEEMANTTKPDQSQPQSSEVNDSFEIGMEYVELIQPLITLSRYAIELEQYDLAIQISNNVQDINENILDSYYIESLANILKSKKILQPNNDNYKDIELSKLLNESNDEINLILQDIKFSLTMAYKIINSDIGEEFDQGLIEQINQLLQELGGPIMSELMPSRRRGNENNDDDDEEEDWEDEIVSDDE